MLLDAQLLHEVIDIQSQPTQLVHDLNFVDREILDLLCLVDVLPNPLDARLLQQAL